MDVLEQIWQYLNHRGLTKSCKALKKEASLNGKQDAAALKSALDMFERKTQKEKSVLANETKKLEIQPEKVVKKAKKEKKSKKLKSKEDASVVVEKQTATSPTAEASEEDTTTLISESKDSTTSLIDGLTEIINQSSTEQEQEAEHTSKKRKLDDLDDTPHKSRNEKAISQRFSRIYRDEFEFENEALKDNTFMAKGGAVGSYGHKAHQDLIVTRGKGFRKEKDKKKRGSYRGGQIDFQSHSIKFED